MEISDSKDVRATPIQITLNRKTATEAFFQSAVNLEDLQQEQRCKLVLYAECSGEISGFSIFADAKAKHIAKALGRIFVNKISYGMNPVNLSR